jgi:hypothetical protein
VGCGVQKSIVATFGHLLQLLGPPSARVVSMAYQDAFLSHFQLNFLPEGSTPLVADEPCLL